jgi:hypothetical protein
MSITKLRLRQLALAAAVVLASAVHGADAATISFGADADTYLRDATARGALDFVDVRGAALDFRGYLRFDMSSLAGQMISNASLSLVRVPGASRNDNVVAARFALYGLNNDAGNTPQNWDEATLVPASKGTEDVTTLMGVTDLDDNVTGISEMFTGTGGDGTVITISGAPLVDFLQGRINDGGLATFILSNDDATDRGYGVGSKENLTATNRPILTIEIIPEPASWLLGAAAIVYVGMGRNRKKCVRDR